MAINGPITGRSGPTTALDSNVTVRVSVVGENGIARPLTHGIQMASMSAFDVNRSRFMNGKLIQPWHPFSAESRKTLTPLTPFRADVEVFPTSAVIQTGEKLRSASAPVTFPMV